MTAVELVEEILDDALHGIMLNNPHWGLDTEALARVIVDALNAYTLRTTRPYNS